MTAAIILAAGKGTRMGRSDCNKVAYDCAGVPVIRRIVRNLREAGVVRFVVVVGYRAESVMAALADEPGVLYAYQRTQCGTGNAALCGFRLLQEIGFSGPVIVTVGDRLVAPQIIRGILEKARASTVVWGVERACANPTGGRIVEANGVPVGVVEFFDAALMSVLPLPDSARAPRLAALGMSAAKQAGVLDFARRHPDAPATRFGLTGDQILAARYANCSLYCFDCSAAIRVLNALKSDNVQGELYLTDALAVFAREGTVALHASENPDEMLTYSTRPELRAIAHRFLRRASAFSSPSSALDLLPSTVDLLSAFVRKYGDRPCVIASAPGRINLMGRHIEHRGGSTNMMATRQRMTFVVSPREDDVVHIANLDPAFPEAEFKIGSYGVRDGSALPNPATTADWLAFLDSPAIKADLAATRGHWVNYVKAAVLRFQGATDMPLCGMDILAAGDIPVAAGLSSSSALVVATAEAIVALNCLNLATREFVDLCGEGEWYVGSRGGSGDHAAMKCARAGYITHLAFKPFAIGEAVPFPASCTILVVNSGEQAKKSEGAREAFNARIRDYETALAEVKRCYPAWPLTYFRDLAFLPEADRAKALSCLKALHPLNLNLPPQPPASTSTSNLPAPQPQPPPSTSPLNLNLPPQPPTFQPSNLPNFQTSPYGVAAYGIAECRRAEDCLALLKTGDFAALGAMMKASHDGDRVGKGGYECSTPRIDALCDRLNATPGVLGSQIVGAGLGGSVIALVEKSAAEKVLANLKQSGYSAFASEPCEGSSVLF